MCSTKSSPDQLYSAVTDPISSATPTSYDLELTEKLKQTLIDLGTFESQQDTQKRYEVLSQLTEVVNGFVYKTCCDRGIRPNIAKTFGAKIYTFGSFYLGVHEPGTDIDALCVFPEFIRREDVFTGLYHLLENEPRITELMAVETAYVPVMKMRFSGIPIDFVCAQLRLQRIPDDLSLSDDTLLLGLDDRCIRSLNGRRVAEEIRRLVPNFSVFQIALRTIRLWAKQRTIYSNVMGFMGGVAWAILVARICQLYPGACEASIVVHFFRVLSTWEWPTLIRLKEVHNDPKIDNCPMPVITPAYPSMCATYNITEFSRRILIDEFLKGDETVHKIKLQSGNWRDLFVSDFFSRYRNYLQMIAFSYEGTNPVKWAAFVESKIRRLVKKLELLDQLDVAHPYNRGISEEHECYDDAEKERILNGEMSRNQSIGENYVQITRRAYAAKHRMKKIYTTSFYIGLRLKPFYSAQSYDKNSTAAKLDLRVPLNEFMELVKSETGLEGVRIRNVKQNHLSPSLVHDAQQYIPSHFTNEEDSSHRSLGGQREMKGSQASGLAHKRKIRSH